MVEIPMCKLKLTLCVWNQWNVWTEFVATMRKQAMSLDSLSSSHPIEVEVNHPDEVNEIFDAIR